MDRHVRHDAQISVANQLQASRTTALVRRQVIPAGYDATGHGYLQKDMQRL